MARPDADTLFRDALNRLLAAPEIVERFEMMEALTVDALIEEEDAETRLELCRYLSVIRKFRSGMTVGFKAMREQALARKESNAD